MHMHRPDNAALRPAIMDERPVRVCILNAQLDTGNLGLQALGLTTLCELAARLPRAQLTILSGWPGRRQERLHVQQPWGPQRIMFEELGCSISRNPWKPGNLRMESLLCAAGLGGSAGIITRCLADADVVLDCSGGDSFTTLYGDWRYQYITRPKHAALEQHAALVLLPQTYGPFASHVRGDVCSLMRQATQVWARDACSATIAREHDATDVRTCPDIAFCLPRPATTPVDSHVAPGSIGINVSGLLWSLDEGLLAQRYQINGSYALLMTRLVERLLTETAQTIALMPHVIADGNHAESDVRAAQALREALPGEQRARVRVMPAPRSAIDAKATIGRFDFFIGTRMHACIAALSSGVPTCAIAYSDKTAGVFETVGCNGAVLDPRSQTPAEIIDHIAAAWHTRREAAAHLAGAIPDAQHRVTCMFNTIARLCSQQHGQRLYARRTAA